MPSLIRDKELEAEADERLAELEARRVADVARLEAEIRALSGLLAEEQKMSTSLRAQLAEGDAARAVDAVRISSLEAQLGTQRDALATQQAIAAAAKPPVVVVPPAQPVEYEVREVKRDANQRLGGFRLVPVAPKKGGS